MEDGCFFFRSGATHEFLDNTMEDDPVIIAPLGQPSEVLDSLGCVFWEELE